MVKELSVIISNRNDLTMLSVTVRSCIEAFRPIGLSKCEIVIVDNSDEQVFHQLHSVLPTGYIRDGILKIYRQDFPCLFTARQSAAEKSLGEYIICVDSHMLIGHNMFLDLLTFMEERSDDPTVGFAHAPINWAHQHERASRHDRDMSTHELGNWGTRYNNLKLITWKGMPWICKREWFLSSTNGINGYGALAEHKISWGGGDMHIGIKPWLLGFKNYAVPTSPGIHIGPFPKIDTIQDDKNSCVYGPDKYRLYSNSGKGPHALGFLISCYILGGLSMMRRNKAAIRERFGRYIDVDKNWHKAISLGQQEKDWLDKHKTISFNNLLKEKPWEKSI